MQLPFLICTVALLLTGGVLTEDLVNEAVTTAPVAVNQTVVPAVPRTEDLVNESAVPVAGRVEPDNTTTPLPPTAPTTATTTVVPTADTTTVPVTTIGPVPTTPIPPPPRPPAPSKGTWIVRDPITNVTCVMATMAATVVVPYTTVNREIWNATLNVPTDARADGSCTFPDQRITLSWNGNASAPLATPNNTVELIFSRNVTNATTEEGTQFYLSDVVVNAYPDPYNFPGAADLSVIQARASRSDLFTTPLNNSYSCRAEQRIPLSTGAVFNDTASLVLRNVQLEAYRTTDDQSFNKAVTCDADGMVTSDIVPIAVGCALAALVVVVLIAYLIGRRRARQRGYQSV